MENINKSILKISHSFDSPKNRLYNAWINAEDLKKWWKPSNLELIDVQNDVREGGNILYVFKNSDQEEIRVTGNYEQVIPSEKLVFTWIWELPSPEIQDGNFKLSIEFIETEKGCILHVQQENFSSEEAIIPHKEGWEKSFKDLSSYLSGSQPVEGIISNTQAGNHQSETNNGAPGVNNNQEKTGYNEIAEQEKVGGYS